MLRRFNSVVVPRVVRGSLLGSFIALIISVFLPKVYESEALIELPPIEGSSPLAIGYDWVWGGRVAAIRGRENLERVISHLGLAAKWQVDSETALARLRQMIDARVVRGSERISIRVRHADKVLAWKIAGEVVDTYREHRRQSAKEHRERRIRDLEKAMVNQEEIVNERVLQLDAIDRRRKKNLTIDGGTTLLHLPDSEEYLAAKRANEHERAVLENMKLRWIGESSPSHGELEPVRIHHAAQVPQRPVFPRIGINLGIGVLVGALLGLWAPRLLQ